MSIGKTPCPDCGGKKNRSSARCLNCYEKVRIKLMAEHQPVAVKVDADREKHRSAAQLAQLTAKYKESLKVIEKQQESLHMVNALKQGLDTYVIEPKHGNRTSEATAVIVASDWHVEETVGPEVGGLNVFTPEIAEKRARQFFQSGLRLVQLLQQDVTISTVVLALLGDFISNDIHEEFTDVNELQPIHALVTAQNFIVSGLQFLLDNYSGNLVVPCHSGNHARTTRTTRFAAENGHSLEYLMYVHLASYFKDEPRITFIIPQGMHSYMQVYDQIIRFQHGHAIKYGGGVGGIFIPAKKAISQWSKARHADLDVFGHFHQLRDGGDFICNGSLIGYNAFALSIKADYEKPRQALFLLDKKRGRTCLWPIILN